MNLRPYMVWEKTQQTRPECGQEIGSIILACTEAQAKLAFISKYGETKVVVAELHESNINRYRSIKARTPVLQALADRLGTPLPT